MLHVLAVPAQLIVLASGMLSQGPLMVYVF